MGRRVGEARRAGEVARRGDVLEQDARVLRLHLAEAAQVCGRHGVEVPGDIGRVRLRRRGPLLEVREDLRLLVVERRHAAVPRAAALEPHAPVALREVAGEPRHLGEQRVRRLVVAVRAEGGDIAQDAVAPEFHPRHASTPGLGGW